MSAVASERNFLFAVLALQMDFITRDQLIAAMNAWTLAKTRHIGSILVEQGALGEDVLSVLDGVVAKHIEKHGGDVEQSLAAVAPLADCAAEVRSLGDPDLERSLSMISTGDGHDTATGAPPAARGEKRAQQDGGVRFRRIRAHRRGGIGEVFLAYDEEVGREVALKEIQQQLVGQGDIDARFRFEAEVTGRLEHPGVAPVYGMGRYADGRPYYAMRFIEGESLRAAIDRLHDEGRKLRRRERVLELRGLLRRLIDVSNVIRFAHSRGVIHRDVKPSNIMLGKFGETLVVDWGLAKSLAQTDAEETLGDEVIQPTSESRVFDTRTGRTIGTPAYMSPEQAAGDVEQVGPSSDVYGLGATLYHILAGRPPFPDGDLATVLRRAMTGDFPRPSSLAAWVPKPLESICLKAMASLPADRYADCEAFSDDLEAWLADERVAAHRDRLTTRLGRFARRRAALVATAGAILVSSTVALTAATVLLQREQSKTRQAYVVADHERRIALEREQEAVRANAELERRTVEAVVARREAQWQAQKALSEAETAQEVTNFLQGLFQLNDPLSLEGYNLGTPNKTGKDVALSDILASAEEALKTRFADRPDVLASVKDSLGMAHLSISHWDRAEQLLTEALELRTSRLGPNHPDAAASHLHLATYCASTFDYLEGYRHSRIALEILENASPPDEARLALAQAFLGYLCNSYSETIPGEAVRLLRAATETRTRLFGEEHRDTAMVQFLLAIAHMRQGEVGAAANYYLRSMRTMSKTPGQAEVFQAARSFMEAQFNRAIGSRRATLESLEGALEKARAALPASHPFSVQFELYVCQELEHAGPFDASEKRYRNVVEIVSESFGNRLGHSNALKWYAHALMRQDRLQEARERLNEALALERSRGGAVGYYEAELLWSLSIVAAQFHEPVEARRCRGEALDLLLKHRADDWNVDASDRVANMTANLVDRAAANRDWDLLRSREEALPALLASLRASFEKEGCASGIRRLADAYAGLRSYAGAIGSSDLMQRASEDQTACWLARGRILRETTGEDTADYADYLHELAHFYVGARNARAAEESFVRAAAIAKQRAPRKAVEALRCYGAWKHEEEEYARAAGAYLDAVSVLETLRAGRGDEARTLLLDCALAQLNGGDLDGFRKTARTLAVEFRRPSDAGEANRVAMFAVVADLPRDEMRRAAGFVRVASDAAPDDPNLLGTLGAALYRSGAYKEAAEKLERAVALRMGPARGWDLLFLAAARRALGDAEAAESWRAKLEAWMAGDESESERTRPGFKLLYAELASPRPPEESAEAK